MGIIAHLILGVLQVVVLAAAVVAVVIAEGVGEINEVRYY
jgi:hypothetical protein